MYWEIPPENGLRFLSGIIIKKSKCNLYPHLRQISRFLSETYEENRINILKQICCVYMPSIEFFCLGHNDSSLAYLSIPRNQVLHFLLISNYY